MRAFKESISTVFNSNHKYLRMFWIVFSITIFLAFLQGSYAVGSGSSLNSSLNSSNYTISYLDSSVGGDVLANPEINQNIPKTNFSSQIFNMTKQGSVVLKFGNGNGPKLLISTGIHGNEPEANIAVMKYLEYIKNLNFNGTLYIIPFDIPLDTSLNTRYYNGTDPNRIANLIGTPGWNLVKFAQDHGINYLLDVHSGASVSSNGLIYINPPLTQTAAEKNWVSNIVAKINCTTGVDSADNPGMIRVFANSNGINSITMEVERDSIPIIVAAETEFKMVMAAVQYLGFPGYTIPEPHVITTNPSANATGVPLSTSPVTITFSENIGAGANYSGIYIKNLTTGNLVSIASKTINGYTLSIQQTLNRLKDCTYQIYVPAGAIKDAAGHNLAAAYTFNYSTSSGTVVDTNPPIITSTNPTANATGIPLNTSPVTINFSENIAAGANYAGIYIKNLSTGNLVSIASKTISGNTLTIIQTNNRLSNCQYQVYLPVGAVKDTAGNNLATIYTFNYSTSPGTIDTTPPTVTVSNPANGATGASLTSPVTITFSENIQTGANFSGIYIKNLTTGKTVTLGTKNISGNTLTIPQASSRLSKNTYQVYIPAGAVKDAAGNNLQAAFSYQFKTA